MRGNLKKMKVLCQYTNTDGKRPKAIPVPKVVDTIDGIRYVFKDPVKFKTTYAYDMKLLTDNYGFMLSDDNKATCVFIRVYPMSTDPASLQSRQGQDVGCQGHVP